MIKQLERNVTMKKYVRLTEYELQLQATEYLHEHRYAFLICSSTNLDSLAGFYQAAQNAAVPYGRYLYTYNNYFKTQLDTFTNTAGNVVGSNVGSLSVPS